MKFIVWIREDGQWVEQGDGPLSKVTAERIALEREAIAGHLFRDFIDSLASCRPEGRVRRRLLLFGDRRA